MTCFFIPKTDSPPGTAPASSAPPTSRHPAPLSNGTATQPQSMAVPFTTSPLVPRELAIPQPVLPVIRDVYLRRRRVEEITGLKTPTLYRYMKQGLFPRPQKLGPNTVGWSASSVQAWFNSRRTAT